MVKYVFICQSNANPFEWDAPTFQEAKDYVASWHGEENLEDTHVMEAWTHSDSMNDNEYEEWSNPKYEEQ